MESINGHDLAKNFKGGVAAKIAIQVSRYVLL